MEIIKHAKKSKGEAPADTSIIEKSHRDPVYKIAWLHGKTPNECASTSTDGQVLWWDVRKLADQTPLWTLSLAAAEGAHRGRAAPSGRSSQTAAQKAAERSEETEPQVPNPEIDVGMARCANATGPLERHPTDQEAW